MSKSNFLRMLVTLFCLGGSAACIYNVYSDNAELKAEAEKLACGPADCFKLLGQQRTPLHQGFTFQLDAGRATTRFISCKRGAFLVGAYTCRVE